MRESIHNILLSICIPSHNRHHGVKKIIDSVLQCKSNKYEIIVVDNNSNDDINLVVKESEKVHIIKRERAISGKLNPRDCLNYGCGYYRMVCLDKDFIDGKHLESFLIFLSDINATGGYCKLNTNKSESNTIISIEKFHEWAYRINHPSGTFVREDILSIDNMMTDYLNITSIYYDFPFINDIMIARCIAYGNFAIYNSPLLFTEIKSDAARIKSFTYNNIDLYFDPSNKRKQMEVYFKNLNSLNVSFKINKRTTANIIDRILNDCTLNYKRIIQNDEICAHYGLNIRKISNIEMIYEAIKTKRAIILSNQCSVGFVSRNIFIFRTMIKIYIKLLLGR